MSLCKDMGGEIGKIDLSMHLPDSAGQRCKVCGIMSGKVCVCGMVSGIFFMLTNVVLKYANFMTLLM